MSFALKYIGLMAAVSAVCLGFWALVRELDMTVAANHDALWAEDIAGAWEFTNGAEIAAAIEAESGHGSTHVPSAPLPRVVAIFGNDSVWCTASLAEDMGVREAYSERAYKVVRGRIKADGDHEWTRVSLNASGILTLAKDGDYVDLEMRLPPVQLARIDDFQTCDDLKWAVGHMSR